MSTIEKNSTFLLPVFDVSNRNEADLRKALENGSLDEKKEALKYIIAAMLNGNKLSNLLMSIIRFLVPQPDHELKKLLMLYWEVVDKKSADGKLLPEMILVCNNLRNDLIHPNEYVRGCTLRLMCKLKEPEILEPLVTSIQQCLEHRHSYVRRNAVLAIYAVYQSFPYLMPDAPEVVEQFLTGETDPSSRRSAFMMLYHCDQERATNWLVRNMEELPSMSDMVQVIALELVRRACRENPAEKSRFIPTVFALLSVRSDAVRFSAANTLARLSSASAAVRAAAETYCQLLQSQSDNNVKLVVLGRLHSLRKVNAGVLQDCIMDLLKVLSTPNMDVRTQALDLALDLVGPKSIEDVILFLRRELQRVSEDEATDSGSGSDTARYRRLLASSIRSCSLKFPEVSRQVVTLLLEASSSPDADFASDAVGFAKEMAIAYPELRAEVIAQACVALHAAATPAAVRNLLWLLGELAAAPDQVRDALEAILSQVRPLPLRRADDAAAAAAAGENGPAASAAPHAAAVAVRSVVLADGTYSTQAVEASVGSGAAGDGGASELDIGVRAMVLAGDHAVAVSLGAALCKLAIKAQDAHGDQRLITEALLGCVGALRACEATKATSDIVARLSQLLRLASDPSLAPLRAAFVECGSKAFEEFVARRRADDAEVHRKSAGEDADAASKAVPPDALLSARQLRRGGEDAADAGIDDDDADLARALTLADQARESDFASRLRRVTQLTGFADPVYAEAIVTIHSFDIVLDVLLVNQTGEVLQNVVVDVSAQGEMRLVERPQPLTLAIGEARRVTCSIKVSNTESGNIFGTIEYDSSSSGAVTGGRDKNSVALNEIQLDIADYIKPDRCSDTDFRKMWSDFEWENKVLVKTNLTNTKDYLDYVMKATNMACLTPLEQLEGDCPFLSANLYAKSVFGEDALLNVSVECEPSGYVCGNVRIRSKTQGIALNLGEKVSWKQDIGVSSE